MVELIEKKRDGQSLTQEEITFFIEGYVNDRLPDYQVSALLMAIYFKGMTKDEIAYLTQAMIHSGETISLEAIPGMKIDKHSTGGVGDKVSLIVVPIIAALGIPVAKMSGRGLGITGGTVDKLESIQGFQTEMDQTDFIQQVNTIGGAIIGQTGNLVPADKKIYALRDVTATVNSIPLIASSIMSKKIASGADGFVLDVKMGAGAFMQTQEEAEELAKTMIDIAKSLNKRATAVITDMNVPLGRSIGNKLEIEESVRFLQNHQEAEQGLHEVSLAIAAAMVRLATDCTEAEAIEQVQTVLTSGEAYACFQRIIEAQGGDITDVYWKETVHQEQIIASRSGFVTAIDAHKIGTASLLTGAGRLQKDTVLDYHAGVVLHRTVGEAVTAGDVVCTLYSNQAITDEMIDLAQMSYEISPKEPRKKQHILKTIYE